MPRGLRSSCVGLDSIRVHLENLIAATNRRRVEGMEIALTPAGITEGQGGGEPIPSHLVTP